MTKDDLCCLINELVSQLDSHNAGLIDRMSCEEADIVMEEDVRARFKRVLISYIQEKDLEMDGK